MSYGIRLAGMQGLVRHEDGTLDEGQYGWLRAYDPAAHAGRGECSWTADPEHALRFESLTAAFECWQQVPHNRPTRTDGKPNRPLAAFNVEILPLIFETSVLSASAPDINSGNGRFRKHDDHGHP
jgi:hypothetical protein